MEKIIYHASNLPPKVATVNDQPSMTKQSMAKDLDVNNIIKRYNKTGVLPNAHKFEAIYGEFDSFDLRTAIEKVENAQKVFMEVPSEIRGKFNNDAGAFIDFATNAANLQQMRKWGLAPTPEPVKEPAPEPTTEPTAG